MNYETLQMVIGQDLPPTDQLCRRPSLLRLPIQLDYYPSEVSREPKIFCTQVTPSISNQQILGLLQEEKIPTKFKYKVKSCRWRSVSSQL
jgi:hypothetical protein